VFATPKSPLVVITVLYMTGVLLGSTFHIKPIIAIIPTIAVFFASLVGYFFSWRENRQLFFVLFFLVGLVMSGLALEDSKSVLTGYAGSQTTLTGRIIAEADVRPDKVFYSCKVNEAVIYKNKLTVDGLVRLQVTETNYIYGYGDVVEVTGLFTRPESPGNPGAFNYRTFLERQGFCGVLLVKGDENIEKIRSSPANPFLKAALLAKERLSFAATASLDLEQAAIFNGVAFGVQGMIDRQTREAFSETGVVHILSVSGLHVGLVVGGLMGLLRLFRVSPRLTAPVITPIIIFYILMVGFVPSALRAAIMCLLLLWASHWGRQRDWSITLAVAALLILLWNPLQIYNPGFQLSFAATWGLLYLIPFLNKICDRWISFLPPDSAQLLTMPLFVTIAAQLATIPLIAWYYNLVSPVSVLANLIVTPLVGLIMLLGFLAALLGQIWLPLAEIINVSNGMLIDFMLYSVSFFQKLPGAVFYLSTPPVVLTVAWYGVLIAVVWLHSGGLAEATVKKLGSWLAMGLVCVLILLTGLSWFGKGELVVHFVDVGQGDCILVQSPYGRNMLIDTGGRRNEWLNGTGTGDQVVTPYLRSIGVKRIDVLVLTHPHDDHAAGAPAIVRSFPIGMTVVAPMDGKQKQGSAQPGISGKRDDIPQPYMDLLRNLYDEGVPVKYAVAGDRLKLDRETEILVLGPVVQAGGVNTNINDLSVVMKLTYREKSFLFTGDVELDGQSNLIRNNEDLRVDVLKMPHHGSRVFLPELLDHANPDIAVISVGAYNTFGHPAKFTLDHLKERQIIVYRTDSEGAIIFRSDGKRLAIETGR